MENLDEAKLLSLIHASILEKIGEARRKGEITATRAIELNAWWQEFLDTYKLPLIERTQRMREVIKKGDYILSDGHKKLVAMILGESEVKKERKVCDKCKGSRWIVCSNCNGSGYLRGSTPRGYIGMPIRSICTVCYGRRGEQCYACNGMGYLEA